MVMALLFLYQSVSEMPIQIVSVFFPTLLSFYSCLQALKFPPEDARLQALTSEVHLLITHLMPYGTR
jgi:hypothetical protein